MEEKILNPEQSMELIARMIQNTRRRMERNAGLPFIVMGYLTAAVSLAIWYGFSHGGNYNWNYLWFVIPLVGLSFGLGRWYRHDRMKETTTYIDRIMGYIWLTFGAVGFLLSMLSIFVRLPIFFIIVLLMGLGTALTGLVIRFTPCTVAGIFSALVLAPLCLFVQGVDQCLIFAATFIVMMVIPGHILNYRSNHPRSHESDR